MFFSVIVMALALVTTHAYVILPKGSNRTGRVVNGYDAAPDQFPYVVLIEIHSAAAVISMVCGGSLIGNKCVLTAAHCVDSTFMLTAYLGLTHADYAEASYSIWNNDIHIHPHYDKLCVNTRNDHRSPCFGDSGGPLVLQSTGELIGVMSTTAYLGCDEGYPAVFIRVTSYLEWIKSISGISY